MTFDDFVGLPYREGARGPDAYDCYGLVAAVFRGLRGVDLPDWSQTTPGAAGASRAISAALAGEVAGGLMSKVDWPREFPADFDIAIVSGTTQPHHVGVCASGGVLHASKAFGSAWHSLARFMTFYPRTEFYRWHR
jgi:cell wall-associated NlpC family hydrolase